MSKTYNACILDKPEYSELLDNLKQAMEGYWKIPKSYHNPLYFERK